MLLIFVGGFMSYSSGKALQTTNAPATPTPTPPPTVGQILNGADVFDPENKPSRVYLNNGKAELVPGSGATITLGERYIILGTTYITTATYNYGGSGSFVYLAAFDQRKQGGWHMADVLFLGDRVVVTDVRADGTTVRVDYLRHRQDQPMAESPSEKAARIVNYANGTLTQVDSPSAK